MNTVPQVVHAEPDYALGSLGSIYVVVWREVTNMKGALHLASGFKEFQEPGKPNGLITIVEPAAPLPAAEVREQIANFLQQASESLVVSAVIFEGEGFRGAAVRGVVTGLTMIARQSYPHRVFADMNSAADWYVTHSPPQWRLRPDSLVESVAQLRLEIENST